LRCGRLGSAAFFFYDEDQEFMRKILSILTAGFLFASAACQKGAENTNRPADHAQHQNTDKNAPAGENYTLEFGSAPKTVVTGENVKLVLTARNFQGETIGDFEIVHEKPMHLIVVSDDLNEFYHLHPEPQPDRTLAVGFAFPHGGQYRLYADFKPKGGERSVRSFPLQVSGGIVAPKPAEPDAKFEKTVGNINVRMDGASALETNRETTLNFDVRDAGTGEFATGMEKYLGESAHFVIISKDLKDFVHAHPVSTENLKNPNSNAPENARMENIPPNSKVSAHVSFPNAGIYKIFVEFKRAGQVIVVPFVVEVKQGSADKLAENTEVPKGVFKIIVGKNGFVPSEVSIRRAAVESLGFIRVEDEICGDGIVLKELGIGKSLPVGTPVIVELPKDRTGEINFACADKTFTGKVVLE
jgi:hypothetical protein